MLLSGIRYDEKPIQWEEVWSEDDINFGTAPELITMHVDPDDRNTQENLHKINERIHDRLMNTRKS